MARSGAKLLDRHDGPPELVDHVFKLALATEGSNTTLGYIVEHRLPPPRGPVCGPAQRAIPAHRMLPVLAYYLEVLADVAARQDDAERAVVLLAAAGALSMLFPVPV